MGRAGALVLSLLLGAAACSGERSGAGASERARPRSVLLVTLDTTRADALSCYGGESASTPALDALAARGTRFARAYATAPLTLPSHASVLTGLLPPEHGLRDNGRGTLPAEAATLAEAFVRERARTAAFVAAPVLASRHGLARGFELYDELDADDEGLHRPGAAITGAALEWLGELGADERFFAWVHYYDAHAPYEPPPAFRDPARSPYFAEVAAVDAEVARLLTWMESAGRAGDTLVVVVGDHGEALGEHDEPEHGALVYDATLHVPLLVADPMRREGRVVATPVSVAGVAPSVLELCGMPPLAGASARSFAPALAGDALASRPVYAESEHCRIQFGWSGLRALITDRWKYVDAPEPELYDLAADPRETRDLAASEPARAAQLDAALAELVRGLRRVAARRAASAATGEADARALEALGYAQGGDPDRADDDAPAGRNPRDHTAVLRLHASAMALAREGRFAEAIAPLQKAIEACPEVASFHDFLGVLHHEAGDLAAARAAHERAIELDPEHERAHFHLANALRRLGREDEALAHYRDAVRLAPAMGAARLALADVLVARGAPEEALALRVEQLARDPRDAALRLAAADLAGELGRGADVVRLVEDGLVADPGDAALSLRMAWILATAPDGAARDGARASELLQHAGARTPRPPARLGLEVTAAVLAELGRFDEARRAAEQAARDAASAGERARAAALAERAERYARGEPFRTLLAPGR